MLITSHKLISRAGDCSIKKFMACKFDDDLKELVISGDPETVPADQLAAAWNKILYEYFDLSGEATHELTMMKSIVYLEARNKSIQLAIWAQMEAVEKLGKPFVERFELFRKKGYRVNWNGNKAEFIEQLDRIKVAEARFHSDLGKQIKELDDYRAQQKQANTVEASRVNFIRMLNELQRFGYSLDKEKSTAEELAVMIHDYSKLSAPKNNPN